MDPTTARAQQEGTALVASLVLVLVLAVFAGTAAQIMAGSQMTYVATTDSVQALYAAESGVELSLKEFIDSADTDSDGTVGGISDDDNASNDPGVGDASFSVDFTSSVITATGSSGDASRVIEVTIQ